MPTLGKTIEDLERRFWDAWVAQDAEAAIELLTEPALMVSAHGAMRFDHAPYRTMALGGPVVLKSTQRRGPYHRSQRAAAAMCLAVSA